MKRKYAMPLDEKFIYKNLPSISTGVSIVGSDILNVITEEKKKQKTKFLDK